ncbi:carboxypeptidase-like regulatory domain-containing protein [uncultured Gimesia sp.]|jgi:hypothetical protein|uniref:carboxypeptidase-like regulatory domain-containing protein n=1 Tax=uncultured Gimesia sp. TaxID=1678688 RepID=UPI00260E1135|nr:carboxypeptidase-like regulatory domain-containing protein [uncultured Gimesia sp.]
MKPFCIPALISPRVLFTVGLLALFSGCGGSINADYSQLDLVDVSGTVTLDGQPLPGAMVTFEAKDGTFSSGVTDESGRFNLMFNTEKSGCLTGDKTVRIKVGGDLENPDEETEGESEAGRQAGSQIVIPAQYNKKSTLEVTVDANHRSFEFDLKSKP